MLVIFNWPEKRAELSKCHHNTLYQVYRKIYLQNPEFKCFCKLSKVCTLNWWSFWTINNSPRYCWRSGFVFNYPHLENSTFNHSARNLKLLDFIPYMIITQGDLSQLVKAFREPCIHLSSFKCCSGQQLQLSRMAEDLFACTCGVSWAECARCCQCWFKLLLLW